MQEKELPELIVTKNGIPFEDQAEGVRQFKAACLAVPTIAGRTLEEWKEFAKRDDCLDLMVPSDLRQLIGCIGR